MFIIKASFVFAFLSLVSTDPIVSAQEAQKIAEKMFRSADKDRNGKLDQNEWSALHLTAKSLGLANDQFTGVDFSAVDLNKDGSISLSELDTFVSASLESLAEKQSIADNGSINTDKMVEFAKKLFKTSYERECKQTLSDEEEGKKFDAYMNCVEKGEDKQCVKSMCTWHETTQLDTIIDNSSSVTVVNKDQLNRYKYFVTVAFVTGIIGLFIWPLWIVTIIYVILAFAQGGNLGN